LSDGGVVWCGSGVRKRKKCKLEGAKEKREGKGSERTGRRCVGRE